MAQALDGYLRGNRRSFSVIRVPSEQEERLRGVSRQRESLMKQRKRLGAQGCGFAVYHGGHLKWGWWGARNWKRLSDELDDYLLELLDPKAYPAIDLVHLYRQRWEHELAYRELKLDV